MGFFKIIRSRRFCRWATLCMLFTVALLWVFWLSWRAHRQRVAVAAVQNCGGQVRYDWQVEATTSAKINAGGFSTEPLQPPGPKWLREIIGDEYFQKVVVVEPQIQMIAMVGENSHQQAPLTLATTSIPSFPAWQPEHKMSSEQHRREFRQMLAEIASLGTVHTLDLTNAPVDAETMARVARIGSLKSLTLWDHWHYLNYQESVFTVRHYPAFDELTSHSFKDSFLGVNITPHFVELKHLETLNLHRTPLDDADLQRIGTLDTLKQLMIDCHGQSLDLTPLAKLTNLKRLVIWDTGADTDLQPLAQLSNLQQLELFCQPTPGRLRHAG